MTNFDQWFAGSKVVDKCGKPLLCYHGTYINFDPHEFHPFSHFGTKKAATHRAKVKCGNKILSVYLRINNPLEIIDTGNVHTVDSLICQMVFKLDTPADIMDNWEKHDIDLMYEYLGIREYKDCSILESIKGNASKNIIKILGGVKNKKFSNFENFILATLMDRKNQNKFEYSIDIPAYLKILKKSKEEKNIFLLKYLKINKIDGFYYKNHTEDRGKFSWIIIDKSQVFPIYPNFINIK